MIVVSDSVVFSGFVWHTFAKPMTKYSNPCTDFGFKKLFGEERNKDLPLPWFDLTFLTE
jgi:hypothetical protein